jgi:DNA-binding NarL/FixJ family response regulator
MNTVMPVTPARPSRSTRILIADSHALTRAGLRTMLAMEPDLVVVGEAADGMEAVRLCRELHPDLVMMNVRLPALDGIAAMRAIKAELPAIAIIVVTLPEQPDARLNAMRAGAAGFLLKDVSQQQLIATVRQVIRDECPAHPRVSHTTPGRTTAAAPPPIGGLPERLTSREMAVLRLLAQGQTNREIALELGLATTTVKTHVEHILTKLGTAGRTRAAMRAVALGLIEVAAD